MRRRWLIFRGRRRVNPFDDAPADRREIRMCFGKRMMNKQQALQEAARMRKHNGATLALEPYKCDVCRSYHVGNNSRKKVV